MKPVKSESSVGMDRLATWDEVRCAMSFLSLGASELALPVEDSSELDCEFDGWASNLPEDTMWFGIVSEMPVSRSN